MGLKESYSVFWFWAIGISAIIVFSIYQFYEIISIKDWLIASIPNVDRLFVKHDFEVPNLLSVSLTTLIGVLLWWRIFKVAVLQGSPIRWGMVVATGRQNEGKAGRLITYSLIGKLSDSDRPRTCLFGCVFRAHPTSDKIVRSRLEFLLLSLPFDLTLTIDESRPSLKRMQNEERADAFLNRIFPYMEARETMPPDRFRHEIHKKLKVIADKFGKPKPKRIDGLNWHISTYSRESQISDDFGQFIEFARLDDGTFYATKLDPDGTGSRTVPDIPALRQLAKNELYPIP